MFYKMLYPAIVLVVLVTINFFFRVNISTGGDSIPGYDFFYAQRSFPFGKIDYHAHKQAVSEFIKQRVQSKLSTSGQWIYAGPNNTGGRLTDIEMDPYNPAVAYLLAASGGVFKTSDSGTSWLPVFDNEATMSMGDMAIAHSNTQIIYVGTGEANGGSGSITYDANGVYKSTDAGLTWTNVGLNNTRMIGKVDIHPTNPDIVFVAALGPMYSNTTERGIYKTTDGGQTWQQVLYINDSTGGIDVTINPQNPDIVYAAMWQRTRRVDNKEYAGPGSGLYKSTDGGFTWMQLTDINGLYPAGSNLSRISVDVCYSQPNVVYAKFVNDNLSLDAIYKSVDDGNSWTACDISSIPLSGGSGEYWFGKIKADPVDPEIVYQIGFDLYKSDDGGNSWFDVFQGAHVDHHAVAIHPLNNNFIMNGNDGGLYISFDGGQSHTHNEELPVTQFYTCEMDYQMPSNLYGGTQDNNCIRTLTGSYYDWESLVGGDGFYCLVDPFNSNNIYCEYQYGNIYSSNDGGLNWNYAVGGLNGYANWNCPIVFDPQNTQVLYTGRQNVYKTTDGAQTWQAVSPDLTTAWPNGGNLLYGTITSIDVSPLNSNIIYAGTDDGKVFVTQNGGTSWTDVSSILPLRWVTRLTCDPFLPSRAYVTLSGYRYNDSTGHIYMTNDYGLNWMDISGNLPDMPLNDVIPDPVIDSVLYVASDAGVYYSENLGLTWQPVASGMPVLVCNDLKLHNPTRTLLAGTYGRGMYKLNLNTISGNSVQVKPAALSLKVLNNPVTENSRIVCEYAGSGHFELKIFNSCGLKLGNKTFKTDAKGRSELALNTILPVSELSAGIYVVSFEINGMRKAAKFIK